MVDTAELLGQYVTVTIDRPLGSTHPRHPDIVYPLNYGFIDGILAGDGMDIDAYVLGPAIPLDIVSATVIAFIQRADDIEDKLVVVAGDPTDSDALFAEWTADRIRAAVNFQERYFASTIVLWKG